MKTVSDRAQDEADADTQHREAEARRLKLWVRYIEKVDAQNIEPYTVGDPREGGNFTTAARSEQVRSSIHMQIMRRAKPEPLPEGYMQMQMGLYGGFINTACDTCATALFDTEPHTVLTSSPPRFKAACVGCGRQYYLDLSLRAAAKL